MNDLIRRQRAVEKTLKKYRRKPFVWGRYDCVKMARSHLVAMQRKRLPAMPHYSSALGAKRALKATGHSSLEELFDSLLPRIAPAEMLLGDIALMQGDETFDAVGISIGTKILGWAEELEGHREDGLVPITVTAVKAAWRA